MRKLLLTTSAILFSQFILSQANTIKDKQGIIKVCDQFMQTFKERKFYDAVQLLKVYSVIDSDVIDTLSSTVEKQMGRTGAYGKILSYDFLFDKTIKDYLIKKFYALRFEKYMLKFSFTFYFNDNEWKITHFNFDEELDELLK